MLELRLMLYKLTDRKSSTSWIISLRFCFLCFSRRVVAIFSRNPEDSCLCNPVEELTYPIKVFSVIVKQIIYNKQVVQIVYRGLWLMWSWLTTGPNIFKFLKIQFESWITYPEFLKTHVKLWSRIWTIYYSELRLMGSRIVGSVG